MSRFVKLLASQQNEIGGREDRRSHQAADRRRAHFRSEPHYQAAVEDNVNGKISDGRFMELSAD